MEKIYLKWPITSSCPLDCVFCNNKKERKNWPNELKQDGINDFTEFVNENNEHILGITITGGEPICHPNFIELCKNLRINFGFITSGLNLTDSKYSPIFENENLKFITISIDCLDKNIVESIRGKDILDEQIKSLKYLINFKKNNPGFKVFVNTVVTKLNINNIKELILNLSEVNVDRIQLFKFHPTGDEKIDNNLKISVEDENEIAEDIVNLYIENEKRWKENGFDLSIRFLSAAQGYSLERKFDRELPIKAKGCDIRKNTIHLKTDTRLKLCKKYYHDEKWKFIKKLQIKDLDLNDVIPNFLVKIKDDVLERHHYNNYIPCSKCKLLLKTCHPCPELCRDEREYVNIAYCDIYKKDICF